MRTTAIGIVLALATGPLGAQMAWGPRPPGVDPPPRWGHAMASDAVRGEIVVFGGLSPSTALNDTWVWNGTWTERFPATAPSPRSAAAMVFDEARRVIVLFGGFDGTSTLLNDTWEWDGRTWSQRTPATRPPPLADHVLAYDVGRGRVVLFGGWDGSASSAETWEWDGTDWVHVTPPSKPPPRWGAVLCFDPGRGVCLLFGGRLDNASLTYYSDTWAWNGGAWTQLTPPESPSGRIRSSMAYNPARDRVVLFGGFYSGTSVNELGDTWEWNGAIWILRSLGPGPEPRGGHALELDRATGRVVLFGGSSTQTGMSFGDTWEYFNLTPAHFEPLGPGCAGSAGVPVLQPVEQSRPWIGEVFELDLRPIPSSGLATPFVLLGASNELWGGVPLPLELGLIGMPGCWLQVSIDVSLPLPNHGGWTGLPLAIPFDYRLLGAGIFAQAFVLDPGAVPAAATSNAGLLVIGAK